MRIWQWDLLHGVVPVVQIVLHFRHQTEGAPADHLHSLLIEICTVPGLIFALIDGGL